MPPPVVPMGKAMASAPTTRPTGPPVVPSKSPIAPPLVPSKSFSAPTSGPPSLPRKSIVGPNGLPLTPNKSFTAPPSGPPVVPRKPSFAEPLTSSLSSPHMGTTAASSLLVTLSIDLEGGSCVELVAAARDSALDSAALRDDIAEMFGDNLKRPTINMVIGKITPISAEIRGEIYTASMEEEEKRRAVEMVVTFLRRPSPFSVSLGRIASRGRAEPIKELKMSCKAAFVNYVRVAPLPPGSLGGHQSSSDSTTTTSVPSRPEVHSQQPMERPRSHSPLSQPAAARPIERASFDSYSQRAPSPYSYRASQRGHESWYSHHHRDEPQYGQQQQQHYDSSGAPPPREYPQHYQQQYEIDGHHMVADRRPTPTRSSVPSAFQSTEYRHGNPSQRPNRQFYPQQEVPSSYRRQMEFYNTQDERPHTPIQIRQMGGSNGDSDFHNQCVNKYFIRRQRSLDAPQQPAAIAPERRYAPQQAYYH